MVNGPRKRKRVSRPDFATDNDLRDLDDKLLQPETYCYSLPLHMGGKRRSLRAIKQELIVAQKRIATMMREFPFESLVTELMCDSSTDTTSSRTPETPQHTISPLTPIRRTLSLTRPDATPQQPVTTPQQPAATPQQPATTQDQLVKRLSPHKRRRQIQFAYELLDTPPEWTTPATGEDPINQWEGKDGVIQLIAEYLMWKPTWRTRQEIKCVLDFVRQKLDSGEKLHDIDAGPKFGAHRSGRHRKISPALDETVARCLQRGLGLQLTYSIVNQKLSPVEVSMETVRRSAKRAYSGICKNRGTKKTGSKDKCSKWATGRKAMALQLSEQFREDVEGESMIGKRVCRQFEGEWFVGKIARYDANEDLYFVNYDDGDCEELEFLELRVDKWDKIPRNAVFWIDEKHKKIRIGRCNRHEWLFHVDPRDPTRLLAKEDGGVLEEERPCTQGKFMGECRGAFGVMRKLNSQGQLVGQRMRPYNYTNKKVVGPVAYEKAFWAEVHRVNTLKTTGTTQSVHWKDRGEDLEGGAYEARYGTVWKDEVKEALGKGGNAMCNVVDIMAHVIEEGNRLFEDTPYARTWVIYHDALSQWWSKGAQDWMKAHGFGNRQVRGLGHTNEGTRYEGKLPGDTPEYMPLDSNLFSDLEVMVRWNVAATIAMPIGHPDKFDLTTPKSAWSAVERSWEHAPTSNRIVEDIERVFAAIEDVVEHEGIAVDFNVLRHGRRDEEHRRSSRRARARKEHKHFDRIEGLHPVSKQCIIDLCNL